MKQSILIVDDNKMMREFLANFLGKKYLVNTVGCGTEAINYLSIRKIPDLVITDLNMPLMNGSVLLDKIKNNSLFTHIPVIILSGLKESNSRIKCLQAGAKDFIIKPFNPEELELRVSRTLKAA